MAPRFCLSNNTFFTLEIQFFISIFDRTPFYFIPHNVYAEETYNIIMNKNKKRIKLTFVQVHNAMMHKHL